MRIAQVGDTYAIVSMDAPVDVRSMWFIGGLHGEEPAPVAALASRMSIIVDRLSSHIPFVILPNANPTGQALHQRFGLRGVRDGYDFVVAMDALAVESKPSFVLDLHEDDELTGGVYIYHDGVDETLPGVFLEAFKSAHIELLTHGYPRFTDQEVIDGLVLQQGEDNSIDQYLNLHGAEVIVIETPASWDMEMRIGVHKLAIDIALGTSRC